VFGTPGIIPSEFWYVWFIMAHLTFGTPVDELHRLVHCTSWYTKWFFGTVYRIVIDRFRHVWYSIYVWYTSSVWCTGYDQCLVHWASLLVSFGTFGALLYILRCTSYSAIHAEI